MSKIAARAVRLDAKIRSPPVRPLQKQMQPPARRLRLGCSTSEYLHPTGRSHAGSSGLNVGRCAGLAKPVAGTQVPIQGRGSRKMVCRSRALSHALAIARQAKMAMGNKRKHAARLSKRQRLAKVILAFFKIVTTPR
jgi:hypothetical protein